MTRTEFWQQCYLAGLTRLYTPGRATDFANEGVAQLDRLVASPGPGRVPVYRLRNGAVYLFTINTTERDNAVAQYGFVLEGIAFYAYEDP